MGKQQDVKVEAGEETGKRRLSGRVIAFVRRRPIVSLGLLAGAGALGGIEWAAGALLGLGAAAIVATPVGRELRQKIQTTTRRLVEDVEHAAHRGDREQPV